MPAWWGRKSNKTKEDQINHKNTLFSDLNNKKSYVNSEINNDNKYVNNNKRSPRSFEGAILSPNLRGSPSGNIDLDGAKKVVGHPLPRPSSNNGNYQQQQQQLPSMSQLFLNNSNQQQQQPPSMSQQYSNSGGLNFNGGFDQGHNNYGNNNNNNNNRPIYPTDVRSGEGQNHGGGLLLTTTSGSASVSSVSSCGSNSDEPPLLLDHYQSGNFSGRGRSPGPGSRAPTAATSPIHPRLAALNWESPTGRQEEGRSQGHPLPLPPSSPTSPSSLPNGRAGIFTENTHKSMMWKKGRLLGRGTFGHVYLGFNSEGGHMCAIKEVRIVSDDQNSRESLKQLNQEINLLSQLSHPNIVRYYGSDLAGDTLSVYLEYVSGGSIHKLLQEYGPFKEPVIQNYTRQILSGLAYLHSRTTVHRDIKGANILVDPTGEIKLADFGMAKHITSCNSVLSFKGSPYWMAPEVVMNKNGYNLAVDIWSLGCTILEMATAKPPWSQYEGVAAIFKIGNSKDTPEIPDFLSSDAKSFLHLCLQRDPADRPLATALLDHPFVRGQSVGRALNINPPNDAESFSFDGRRKPQPLDIHPRRKSISSYDMEQMRRPGLMIWEPRDNPRSITSLPVSPSSSPLHRLAPYSKSCFLSPPHPSYAWPGQNNYNPSDHSTSPTRRRVGYTLDPYIESTLFKTQTPGGSPTMRLL